MPGVCAAFVLVSVNVNDTMMNKQQPKYRLKGIEKIKKSIFQCTQDTNVTTLLIVINNKGLLFLI